MKKPHGSTRVLSDTQWNAVQAIGFDYDAAQKTHVTECNLCGSRVWTQLAHHDRYYHQTDVYQCNSCGTVFISPVMTEADYGRFYANYYRPLVTAYHGRLIDANTYKEDQKPYAEDLVAFLSSAIRDGLRPASIVDIGSSTGVVVLRLAEEFSPKPRMLCLDPNITELREAEKLGLEAVLGFVETHDFGGDTFDLVLLCQTIDHLLDIKTALEKIREMLTPDGYFFVDFVDFRRVYLNTGSVEGAIKIDHCYYLTDATMEAYLDAAGFEVVKKGIARDKVHVNYLCRRSEPKQFDKKAVSASRHEVYTELRALRGKA